MPEPQPKDSRVLELEAWKDVVVTDDWKYFIKLLKEHEAYLQKEIHQYLKTGEYRLADRAQAKCEDAQKIIDLVQGRLNRLKNPQEGGE